MKYIACTIYAFYTDVWGSTSDLGFYAFPLSTAIGAATIWLLMDSKQPLYVRVPLILACFCIFCAFPYAPSLWAVLTRRAESWPTIFDDRGWAFAVTTVFIRIVPWGPWPSSLGILAQKIIGAVSMWASFWSFASLGMGYGAAPWIFPQYAVVLGAIYVMLFSRWRRVWTLVLSAAFLAGASMLIAVVSQVQKFGLDPRALDLGIVRWGLECFLLWAGAFVLWKRDNDERAAA